MIDLDMFWNQAFVGKMVKHYTITCDLCQTNLHLQGNKRKVIRAAKNRGWFVSRDAWFCSRHDKDDVHVVQNDPDRYSYICDCRIPNQIGHSTNCVINKPPDLLTLSEFLENYDTERIMHKEFPWYS